MPMTAAILSEHSHAVPARRVALGLSLLGALAALLLGALLWFATRPAEPVRGDVVVTLGSRVVVVDASLVRSRTQRLGGAMARLDLLVAADTFLAPVLTEHSGDRRATPVPLSRNISLLLQEADDSLAPQERPSLLYGRFLEPAVWSNPGGLIMRRFRADSPYQGEELFLTAPDGRDFAARCPASGSNGTVGDRCLAIIRTHGIDVEIGFDRTLLSDWEALRTRVLGLLTRSVR